MYAHKDPTSKKNVAYQTDEVKKEIINYLYACCDLGKLRYRFLQTIEDLQFLKENKHHVSPNFSGKNAYLIFKKLKTGYYSVLVDKKPLKYNRVHVDVSTIRLMPLNVKARMDIYNGTILDGKLIKVGNPMGNQKGSKSVFLVCDVLYLEGKNMMDDLLENKLINIKIYLEQHIKTDGGGADRRHSFGFDINKLYDYTQLENMLCVNKNHPTYKMYGVVFYPPVSGNILVFNNLDTVKKIIVSNNIIIIWCQDK